MSGRCKVRTIASSGLITVTRHHAEPLEVPDPWAALPVEAVTAVSSSTLSLHPDVGPLSTKGTLGFYVYYVYYVYFSAGNKGKAAPHLC